MVAVAYLARAESFAYVRDVIGQIGQHDPVAGQKVLDTTLGGLTADEQIEIMGGPTSA